MLQLFGELEKEGIVLPERYSMIILALFTILYGLVAILGTLYSDKWLCLGAHYDLLGFGHYSP